MPIEIRELIIKAEIDSGTRPSGATAPSGGGLSEEAIQLVVDKVVEIINNKKER